jgi:hypothetical protein
MPQHRQLYKPRQLYTESMHSSSYTHHTSQPRTRRRRQVPALCLAIACIAVSAFIAVPARFAAAQAPGGAGGGKSFPIFGGSQIPDDKTPPSRTVDGRVLNNDDVALIGAVVYIRDLNTNKVLSLFADDTASFRYGQLDRHVDYRVWAEYKGKKSTEKLISNYDKKDVVYLRLRIDTPK